MQAKSDRLCIALMCCTTALAFGATNAWAWVRHNLMTKSALESISWLDAYDQITVTPYTYQDDSLNPNFKVVYTNPVCSQVSPAPEMFVYYTLKSEEKAGFKGAEIGQKTTALQILIDYSDEPDWAMDKELTLSKAQVLMAGSQGYRHMYYPAWDWHLPWCFFPKELPPNGQSIFLSWLSKRYPRVMYTGVSGS